MQPTNADERLPLIAHVVLSLDVGGMERVVLDLIHGVQQRGFRTAVVCLEREGALALEAQRLGAEVVCVDKRPGLELSTSVRLARVFRRLRPNVVHTHQIGALFYAGPAALSAGAPWVVHTEHGKHFTTRRSQWLGRLAGCFAERFFCVSQDLADDVARRWIVPGRKRIVAPNGIDTAKFHDCGARQSIRQSLGISPESPLIGSIGRLSEVKRQEVLLHGFAALHTRFPAARLLLVGDGSKRESLQALAAELKIEPWVHFVGYQPQPQKFLAAMDVFALTSRSEGMPLVVLEAWAAGLPVVASHVGGLGEMIAVGRDGRLFPEGDSTALAAALAGLLDDPEGARRMGQAGREKAVRQYDVNVMCDLYCRHYHELLASRGGSASKTTPTSRVASCGF